jgi:hypothetical protein
MENWDRLVSIVIRTAEESGFNPQQGKEILLFSVTSILAVGPTQSFKLTAHLHLVTKLRMV